MTAKQLANSKQFVVDAESSISSTTSPSSTHARKSIEMVSNQSTLALIILSFFIVAGCSKPVNPEAEANSKLSTEEYDKKVHDEESKQH
jgi:hypothetical protein